MGTIIELIFKNIRGILALSVVHLGFFFLFLITTKKVPLENKDIINLSAGIVLATMGVVVGYYFGSSKDKSDSDKAATNKELIK